MFGYGNAQGFTTCGAAIDVISLEARIYNNGLRKDTDIDTRYNYYVANDASATTYPIGTKLAEGKHYWEDGNDITL